MVSRANAKKVKCPSCGAKVGRRCVFEHPRNDGRVYRLSCHRERHEKFLSVAYKEWKLRDR